MRLMEGKKQEQEQGNCVDWGKKENNGRSMLCTVLFSLAASPIAKIEVG